MNRRCLLAVGLALLVLSPAGAVALATADPANAARPETVPALRSFAPADGRYALPRAPRVVAADRRLRVTASTFAADLRALTGRRVRVARGSATRSGDLVLRLGATDRRLGREGYALTIARAGVVVRARTRAGVFYGTRTILQLLRRRRTIPAGRARDWPRHRERGLMVDVGRKHFSVRWLASHIRELAYLKLNQLHLHLTDNEGWRIASERHPEVVSRPGLSKRQVRSLVRLAARYHVRVVPEIDMPGHMGAALARHPELQLADTAGRRNPRNLDISLPAARRFARELIEEYLPLFPGPYWHMGADEYLGVGSGEAAYDRYPQLGAFARSRHGPTANGKDAILSFVAEIEQLVRRHRKTLRIWHDGLGGGRAVRIPSRVVVEWWTDGLGPTPNALLTDGHRVLNAGWYPTYYVVGPTGRIRPDMRSAYATWSPHHFLGFLSVFPTPGVPPSRFVVPRGEPGLLGSELHVWNDDPTGETEEQIAAGIFPRLRVLAQKTWGTRRLTRSYDRFTSVTRILGRAPGYR